MCDIVYDEMTGHIDVMRNVLRNMVHLFCNNDKENLRKFYFENINTVKQINYFLNQNKTTNSNNTKQVIDIFEKIQTVVNY